jgi:two-component system, chemotaxis family, CheB/CheR fusion protein
MAKKKKASKPPRLHRPVEDEPEVTLRVRTEATALQPPKPVNVVGIGASAGGLAALKQFFAEVPDDSGFAFVIVVHLSPEHKSHLAELLQPHVPMPVQQVTATMPLEVNHVYVIPPNANLDTIDTHLRLSELEKLRQERAPIDHFFRTLGKTHDGSSIGVVLTGTGSDGTLGLKEIRERGGFAIVQDPTEAEFDGMPQSAIATGVVDVILPVAKIFGAIQQFTRTDPKLPPVADDEPVPDESRKLLYKLFAQLRSRTGRDFSRYKRSTILRRIQRRMQLRQIEKFPRYLDLMRDEPEEARILADDLLITVTSFFRDSEVFEKLERDIVPALFKDKGLDDEIRIWSVGCSTGEEAYSLAILLLEEAARSNATCRIQVFASDLHEHSLAKAREGFYPGDIETDVSPERLKRYFIKENGGYRIRKEVREIVVFAPHNLMGDPPFSRIDLITCRNLLIYIQRDAQRDIIEVFHYALRSEGYLILGSSETLDASELFRLDSKKCCVYRKRNVPAPEPRLPVFPLTRTRIAADADRNENAGEPIVYGTLHQRMVEQYAPPSALVTPDDKVVHLSEHAGRYLLNAGGEPTLNVIKLVRRELQIELRAALHAVRRQNAPVSTNPVQVRFNGESGSVVMHVRASLEPHQAGFALIIFEERTTTKADAQRAEDAARIASEGQGRVGELEAELDQTRGRLQAIIEEYETSQEEMKASNEEMQSTNEELRSTMEELETSREELQSMNEELQTVNQENRHKVEELSQLSSDLQNLLAATDIATLFLDRNLRILRFTPKVSELFNVRMTDRGRPLSDLTHRLGYTHLQDDAARVLEKLVPIERELQDEADRWYLTRVMPYRSSDDRIEGVVITFVEITARKSAMDALHEQEQQFRTLVEQIHDYAIFMTDQEGRPTTWNEGVRRVLGFGQVEFIGKRITETIFTPEDQALGVPTAEFEQAASDGSANNDRWMLRKDGTRFWAAGITAGLRDAKGELLGFMKIMRDQTEQKKLENELRRVAAELADTNRRKDEFLATLAHELRNPLAPIRAGLDVMKVRNGDPSALEEARGILERQTDQLVMLVDDLLDVSRITRGVFQLRRRRIDLSAIVSNAIEAARPFVDEREHRLELDVGERPIYVDVDPNRIAQVLTNLLINATKYTSPGGTIWFAARQENGQAVLSVRDNGSGIPAEKLAYIFEMFAQIEQQESDYLGLGIGLTIAKRLVELHGGRLEVTSEGKGKGSEFIVRLPVAESELSAESPRTAVADAQRAMRVLVVDDNVSAARMLSKLVSSIGHEARIAHDGVEAIELADQFRPEVVLMDIGMPNMNGYDAARHIRLQTWGEAMKLVALTGWGQDEDRKRSKEAGFDSHLVKPANLDTLKSLLAECNGGG